MEILVALGLLGVLSLGVTKLIESMNKGAKGAKQTADYIGLDTTIGTVLADNKSCQKYFLGANTPGLSITLDTNCSENSANKICTTYTPQTDLNVNYPNGGPLVLVNVPPPANGQSALLITSFRITTIIPIRDTQPDRPATPPATTPIPGIAGLYAATIHMDVQKYSPNSNFQGTGNQNFHKDYTVYLETDPSSIDTGSVATVNNCYGRSTSGTDEICRQVLGADGTLQFKRADGHGNYTIGCNIIGVDNDPPGFDGSGALGCLPGQMMTGFDIDTLPGGPPYIIHCEPHAFPCAPDYIIKYDIVTDSVGNPVDMNGNLIPQGSDQSPGVVPGWGCTSDASQDNAADHPGLIELCNGGCP